MKKFIFLLVVLLGLTTLVACGGDDPLPEEIILNGINISDATGQGTESDPFSFTVTEDDNVSADITVAPLNFIPDLTFEFVEPSANGFEVVNQSSVTGIQFNTDNDSSKLSVKAVTSGTYYIKISQDSIAVYVEIVVEAKEVELPPIDFTQDLKVLAIGNSFSEDAMAYLYGIADDYGVENIVLGNLYIGGAELSQHANNAENDAKNYTYRKNDSGSWVSTASQSILDGLLDEDWDIITIQQVSGKSGRSKFFDPYLNTLI